MDNILPVIDGEVVRFYLGGEEGETIIEVHQDAEDPDALIIRAQSYGLTVTPKNASEIIVRLNRQITIRRMLADSKEPNHE